MAQNLVELAPDHPALLAHDGALEEYERGAPLEARALRVVVVVAGDYVLVGHHHVLAHVGDLGIGASEIRYYESRVTE